jgi:ABC-type nitrate/sulfonate/bicarbonate transport system substrate-binding protein
MRALKILLAAGAALVAFAAAAQQPVKIRVGWVVPVSNLASFMYSAKDVLRHHGKSYVAEATRFQGSTPQLTALGTGDLDVALLGFTSLPLAIQNARMEDLRVIVDEIRDGVPGYYSNEFWVRNDGAVRSVADLKGRVLTTNAAGSAVDVAMRAMLRKQGLDDKSFTVVEAAFPNMRGMLLEKKVDLVPAVPPFSYHPELKANARVLFTATEALGPNMLGIWVARTGFLQKNRAAVVDFLEDYLRIVRFMTDPANHKAAVELASASTKLPANLLDAWLFTKADYYHPADGILDTAALQSNFDAIRSLGFLKERIDASKYVDMSYIKEAGARLK